MFHTMHMSSYPKMYTSRYTTKRWISPDVWEENNEKLEPPPFMCCFKIETGGLNDYVFYLKIVCFGNFIEKQPNFDSQTKFFFLELITNTVVLAGLAFAILFVSLFGDCKNEVDGEDCSRGLIIFASIMLMPFTVSFMAMSYSCLKGMEKRDHKQIKSVMIWLGFTVIVSFLSIFTCIIPVVIIGTVLGLLFLYFFFVIYTLYNIFLIEHKRNKIETAKERKEPVTELSA